jgi:hypothetical protein
VNFGDASRNIDKSKGRGGTDTLEDEEEAERQRKKDHENDIFEKIMRKNRNKQSKVDFIHKNMEQAQLD